MTMRVANGADNRGFDIEQRIAEVLQRRTLPSEDFATASHAELLHELSVYHQELEFQNDELRATQIELEAIKNRYADLFDHAPYGYVVIDSDMTIQLANQTLGEMVGLAPKALSGVSLTRFIDPASQDTLYLHLRTVFGEKLPQSTELVLGGLGKRVAVRVQSLPDFQSGVIFARMAFIDITREKAALDALRTSETRYRLLSEMADDIVLVCALDQAGALAHIVEANNAASTQLGYEHGRLLGMPLTQVLDSNSLPPDLYSTLKAQRRAIFETRFKPLSEPLIPVEVHASLFERQGQPMALLVARDITQRLQLESERREIER